MQCHWFKLTSTVFGIGSWKLIEQDWDSREEKKKDKTKWIMGDGRKKKHMESHGRALLQQYEDINTQTPPPINAFTCPYLSIHPHIVWVYECMSCMYPCVHVFVSLILPICSIFVLYLYFTTLINYSPFDYSLWLHALVMTLELLVSPPLSFFLFAILKTPKWMLVNFVLITWQRFVTIMLRITHNRTRI